MTSDEFIAGLLVALFESPVARFDRMTKKGYKLNLITGKYYEPDERPTTGRESHKDNQRGEQ